MLVTSENVLIVRLTLCILDTFTDPNSSYNCSQSEIPLLLLFTLWKCYSSWNAL